MRKMTVWFVVACRGGASLRSDGRAGVMNLHGCTWNLLVEELVEFGVDIVRYWYTPLFLVLLTYIVYGILPITVVTGQLLMRTFGHRAFNTLMEEERYRRAIANHYAVDAPLRR